MLNTENSWTGKWLKGPCASIKVMLLLQFVPCFDKSHEEWAFVIFLWTVQLAIALCKLDPELYESCFFLDVWLAYYEIRVLSLILGCLQICSPTFLPFRVAFYAESFGGFENHVQSFWKYGAFFLFWVDWSELIRQHLV